MDAESPDRKHEVFSGQIEALRVLVIAMATLMPNRTALRQLIQELLTSQRELLLAQAVSDEFLSGLELAGQAMLRLLPPSSS